MGQAIIDALARSPDLALSGALEAPDSPALGRSVAPGVAVTADLAAGLERADVLIDFTRPEGTLAHAAACRERGIALVVGTTGFSDAQKAEIAAHARAIPIVMAPNMSVGVNVVLKLLA